MRNTLTHFLSYHILGDELPAFSPLCWCLGGRGAFAVIWPYASKYSKWSFQLIHAYLREFVITTYTQIRSLLILMDFIFCHYTIRCAFMANMLILKQTMGLKKTDLSLR